MKCGNSLGTALGLSDPTHCFKPVKQMSLKKAVSLADHPGLIVKDKMADPVFARIFQPFRECLIQFQRFQLPGGSSRMFHVAKVLPEVCFQYSQTILEQASVL
jgi:hypothetical protein